MPSYLSTSLITNREERLFSPSSSRLGGIKPVKGEFTDTSKTIDIFFHLWNRLKESLNQIAKSQRISDLAGSDFQASSKRNLTIRIRCVISSLLLRSWTAGLCNYLIFRPHTGWSDSRTFFTVVCGL